MNGTITTLAAVIKAFLDGVVYISPIVCTVNARNKNIPKIPPAFNNFLPILARICLKNSKFIIIAAKKNLKVMICRGVSPPSNANWVATKPLPHIIAINISPIFSIKPPPFYFFAKL